RGPSSGKSGCVNPTFHIQRSGGTPIAGQQNLPAGLIRNATNTGPIINQSSGFGPLLPQRHTNDTNVNVTKHIDTTQASGETIATQWRNKRQQHAGAHDPLKPD